MEKLTIYHTLVEGEVLDLYGHDTINVTIS
jgi:hypothetical protein